MKLEQLYVRNYRVLRDLTLHFERTLSHRPGVVIRQGYALDFLAGVNGTGKTTALQFIARAFAHLYSSDHFAELFDLTYTLGALADNHSGSQVRISNIPAEDEQPKSQYGQFQYQVGPNKTGEGKVPMEFLPSYVVIYTTGSEEEWERVLSLGSPEVEDSTPTSAVDTLSVLELPGHQPDMRSYDDEQSADEPDPKLLFIREKHLPLVALCGLLASRWHQADDSNQVEVLASVLKDIQLEALPGFSLRLRAHANLTEPYQLEIIRRLEGAADQIIQSGADRLLLFDIKLQLGKRTNSQPSVFTLYNTPIDLFRFLHTLYDHRPFYDPPLQEVNLFFRRLNQTEKAEQNDNASVTGSVDTEADAGASMLLLYDWLSDGERSFLARMALFALFRADNLLILLDEPEVHFNDVWKREIVQKLDEIMRGCTSHAIITTHSSIALSDVPSDDVLVLRRDGKFTSGEEHDAGINTFGADPSDIMVHVFGTLSPNGERSRTFIREEIGRRDTAAALTELSNFVAPGYWRYRIQLEAQSRKQ